MTTYLSTSRTAGNTIIKDHSCNQLQTFFDELKNGTRNYRTVASLDSQVAQAYRGRCILELLQNAHDALHSASSDDPRVIKFVLTTSPAPVLLVGNSGQPFRKRDFKGLCQLGQSPKDPNESVGNKGLGFRSVFEASSCPEIWSSAPSSDAPSFAFCFNPSVLDRVASAARKLAGPEIDIRSPFDPERPLVDWLEGQFDPYRKRATSQEFDIVDEVEKYLSPYQFPLPAEEVRPNVEKLLDEGFVTVLWLPLDGGMTTSSESAIKSISAQLEELNAQSMIFLHHIKILVVEIDGMQRILERNVDAEELITGHKRTRHEQLLVENSGSEAEKTLTRQFHVWRRDVGGDDDPLQAEKIRDLVEHLPNRWPEVRTIELGIAVENTETPRNGFFVIFLPTEMKTWTGTHINAPFFGSLDRRQINFKNEFNKFLLDSVLDLCLDVVTDLVSGEQPNDWQAKAVIDILSSSKIGDLDRSITECLKMRAIERDCALENRDLIFCDDGWCAPPKARLMPKNIKENALGSKHWRKHAGFAVVSSVLEGRRETVEYLLKQLGGSPDPTDDEWVQAIERIANRVRHNEIKVSWDTFLNGVIDLPPISLRIEPRTGFLNSLASARFLPDQDGRLIRAAGKIKIFFRPTRGIDDAEGFAKKVPDCLVKHVAFLHSSIRTQEGQEKTEVRKFLERRFVRAFTREEILRDVVIPALPELPISHGSGKANLCSELLAWTIQLLGENLSEIQLKLIKRIPVACHGGWYAIGAAGFGPGWSNRLGDLVWSLAEELPEPASNQLRETLLLRPDDIRWCTAVDVKSWNKLFAFSEMTGRLRPRKAENLRFKLQGHSYELPPDGPADTPKDAWDDWRAAATREVKALFLGNDEYVLSDVHILPELHQHENLSAKGRKVLSQLLLASLAHWPDGWQNTTIKIPQIEYWTETITSPLKHWLSTIPWLYEGSDTELKLSRRWLVPTPYLRGPKGSFKHLAPLSMDLARKVESDLGLYKALKNLGLKAYPEEDEKIGPELLDALATAWVNGSVPLERFDVFVGQIRYAWGHFDQDRSLPEKFIVRAGPRKFSVRKRSSLADVFLPDNSNRSKSLKDHRKFLLEMRAPDADRLAETLLAATDIKQASSLEERHFVDGALWKDAEKQFPSLKNSKFKWLPVPLLAVAAHGGNNPSGPETMRWRDAVERLRRTRLLDCKEIEVQLVDGDEVLAESRPYALWLSDDVLAIRRDINTSYEKLAPAAEMLLERRDLLKDLLLVLGELRELENPTNEQIETALEIIRIEPEELSVILANWSENTILLANRIRPVLVLLGILHNGFERAAAKLETLTEWLDANVQQWLASEMLEAARQSHDDHEMGLRAWRALGDIAELPAWNVVLSELGQPYVAVENEAADQQVAAHLNEIRPLLLAFARYVAVEVRRPELFRELDTFSQNFQVCNGWRQQWWEVPFSAVIDAMRVGYSKILDENRYLDLLEGIESANDLRAAFQKLEIPIDPDPYEIARQNRYRFERILYGVYDLYRAWMTQEGSEPVAPNPPELPDKTDPEAYLSQWSESQTIEKSIQLIGNKAFTSACDGCLSLDEIRYRLQLDANVVETNRRERQEHKREKERHDRTVDIAGMAIEKGSTNYSQLWEHLEKLPIPLGPDVSKDEFTHLRKFTSPSRSNEIQRSRINTNLQIQFSEHPELIGIVGEMHAYNFLRNKFGHDVVTQAAWVSANRKKAFPLVEGEPDETSDSLGFDFRFSRDGEHWYIEVKSTVGDDPQFELGISEINAATRLSAEVQGKRWRILRIRNTLSDKPEFDWLPNPFQEQYKSLFRLHRGGMWVSYAHK